MRMPRTLTEWILAVFGGFYVLLFVGLALALLFAES